MNNPLAVVEADGGGHQQSLAASYIAVSSDAAATCDIAFAAAVDSCQAC